MNIQVARGRRLASTVLATLIGVVALTACGDAKAPSTTQVAVRVNKSEISIHQVNYALQGVPGGAANASDAATRQVVDRLISQQLAVDRALELKLDLVPEVQQALQEARRNVLSRAYFERMASGLTQPDPTEVSAFYDKRPELFARRRNYTIQEIDIEASDAQLEALKKRLGETSMPAFAEYLRGSGLRYKSRLLNEPSENLSMELIERLAAMKEGQSIYSHTPWWPKGAVAGVRSARAGHVERGNAGNQAIPAQRQEPQDGRKRPGGDANCGETGVLRALWSDHGGGGARIRCGRDTAGGQCRRAGRRIAQGA